MGTVSTAPAKQISASADPADAELLERFCAGERRAFDELVRRHQRSVYYLAFRYLNNPADAADVTQRTFLRAFQSADGFRGAASVRTWIYRIAINLSLNHIRDNRREQAAEIHENALTCAPLGAAQIIAGQEAARLREAIRALPPKQRLVLELRVYDDLSFRDVAELAECTENAAKVNFHHAVKRLRELLAEAGPGAADPVSRSVFDTEEPSR